jgi:hypothetical protein
MNEAIVIVVVVVFVAAVGYAVGWWHRSGRNY